MESGKIKVLADSKPGDTSFLRDTFYSDLTWRQRPKKTSEPVDLESSMVVNHHMGAGNQTQVFWESSQCS